MAIVPYSDHIGTGAAVHLRTPQVPDWTAKYQLAAQERRAREAERARVDKDQNKEAGDDLRKTISGINPTWAKEDTEGIDRMYNDIWKTMDASGGNYSDPNFQQEISKKVWDLKAAMDLSKNWETRANTRTKEIVDNGVDEYENVEVFNDLKAGKFSLPDAKGGSIDYDIKNVKTLEDFAKFNQAREMAMDRVQKKFDENTYMAKQLPLAKKGATVTDYVTLPNGDKEVRTVEKPEIYQAELSKVFQGKEKLRKTYEDRFAADPKGFASAEEMFQAAYNPYFGTKKTTPKNAAQSKSWESKGNGSIANDKVSATYTQDDNGNEFIGFDWIATEGKPATRAVYVPELDMEVDAYPVGFKNKGKDIKAVWKYKDGDEWKQVDLGYYNPISKGSSETIKTVLSRNYGLEYFDALKTMDLLDKTPSERKAFIGKAGSNAAQGTGTSAAPQTAKKVKRSTLKGLVGTAGYEDQTEQDLIDYYKANGYTVE